jgi:hypothetical protein
VSTKACAFGGLDDEDAGRSKLPLSTPALLKRAVMPFGSRSPMRVAILVASDYNSVSVDPL